MESENPVWLGEYVWEETPLDGGPPKPGPLPAEVLSMFRPQHCLLCGITTANMQTAYTHYESKGHFKKVTHHMREKYNALGSLKSNKEKFRVVKCDICDVELTSRIVYLQHYDGKQHLKNIKKRGFKPPADDVPPGESFPNPTVPDPEGAAKDLPPPPPPLTKLGDYVCALCNVTTATRGQMQVHNNGSRHMKNVAKLADGELRDFYMTNGNCEPMDNDEMEGAAKDNSAADQPSGQTNRPKNPQPPNDMPPSDQSHGGYNGGYGPPGPPVDPSMMQPFPQQMPYGSYPQYPMPYDYNSWGQSNMYPGYNSGPPPYNGQYGPNPYGPGPQQYPPYGYQGPPPEYYNQQQFNQGQQQFNPGQQQFNQGQPQFNPGQQYSQGPQQYNQGPQFNQGQYNPEQQQQYDYHDSQSNYSGRDQHPNPSPKDPRRHSRNREPPKEPEVNETPLPDGVKLKPLAVLPFISKMVKDSSEDRPPGVDAPPGIDKPEDQYSNPLAESPSFKDTIPFVKKDSSVSPSDKAAPKVEPKSPPRTLLDLVRENNKLSKLAKEEDEKAKVSDAPGSEMSAPEPTDLPPIPGLDSAPFESKPPIITWTEANKEGEPEPKEDLALENGITRGGVVPPPPHPLNPPIDFLLLSPESEVPVFRKTSSPQPKPSLEPQASSVGSTQSYSQPQLPDVDDSAPSYTQVSSANSNPSQASSENIQPQYAHPPVPSANQVSSYTQPLIANPQQAYRQPYPPVKPEPPYPQVPNYNAPYISTPPVSYSQTTPTNYPTTYPQITTETSRPYLQVPSAPSQTLTQPIPQPPQTSQPKPPSIPPPPTELEKTPSAPSPTATQAIPQQATDDIISTISKEDDPSKPTASKPKINSFFRRAAEKMFKEHKEKKMKEEAKKLEKDPPIDAEPVKKSKEPGKDAIVIIPPTSGPKSGETTADTAPNLSKPRAHESVSETDNDVGSEPGEIVDKKPKTEKIVETVELTGQTSTEPETPKSEKSKFDFGSKKSSDNRRKRSFRVRKTSVSRSRSRSRTPKRRGRRRSRSWSPSPEKSPVGYYQRNTFQSYYGNDTSYWRNDRTQYRSYEDWNEGNNRRYERRRDDRDEFGRERKWKEEKKKEDRKKKKRKSRKRSHSSSASPPPLKASKGRKDPETKKKPSPSPPPVAKPPRPKLPEPGVSVDTKPVTVSLMQRLKGVLPATLEKPLELFPKKDAPAKLVEEVKNTVEVRDVLIRPDVDSDEAREVEKEEQEILKKVALIKKKLLEKEDEKPVKNKKRKKEKSKRRKKRKRSSSSSDSDSSSSDSSSSSSSSSSTSSSSSSTSAGSEPKSKRIVESLLSKLSRQAATGEAAPFDLSMLPALVKKPKKSDGSKKKKKDKKRKKKKKDKKSAPEPPLQVLSAFITPDGAYHCKCCNLTTTAGSSFLEHLISEKHKLLCKLMSTAK